MINGKLGNAHYSRARMGYVCPDCGDVVHAPEGSLTGIVIHSCPTENSRLAEASHEMVCEGPHPSLEMGAQHVVCSSRDIDNIWQSTGPIAHETMLSKSTLQDAVDRAGMLKRYGEMGIFRLVYVGTPEECEAIIKGEMPF